MLSTLSKGFNCIQEVCFSFFVPIHNSLPWILREHLVFYNELMQIVSQEVSTGVATMSVKDTKEATFGPVLNFFLCRWLHNVENNTDTIFVVVSDYTLVRVCSVAHYYSIFSHTALGWLPTWQVKNSRVRWWSCSKKKFFYVKGFILFNCSLLCPTLITTVVGVVLDHL